MALIRTNGNAATSKECLYGGGIIGTSANFFYNTGTGADQTNVGSIPADVGFATFLNGVFTFTKAGSYKYAASVNLTPVQSSINHYAVGDTLTLPAYANGDTFVLMLDKI